MSGRFGGWAPLVLAGALVLLATPSLAAPGALQGRIQLPIEVDGARDAFAGHGAFLATGSQGTLQLTLDHATGTAMRVQHRAFGYVNAQDPQAAVLWHAKTLSIPLDLDGAVLGLDQRLPQFQLYASDADAHLGGPADAGPLLVGGLSEGKTVTERLQRPLSIEIVADSQPYAATIPAGQFQARANQGDMNVDGPFKLFLSEARLTLARDGATQQVPALFRTEELPGALYNPVTDAWFGPGTHTEYVQETLQIDAVGHLGVHFAGLPGTLYSSTPSIHVQGDSVLPGMDGTVRVADKDGKTITHTLSGQELTLGGSYALRLHDLDGDSKSARLDGSGDLTTVSYGAVTAHYPWGAAAAAVGIGALLLAGAAWVLTGGKSLLGGAAGSGLLAGYARVHGEEVLEHPGRQEVYERVKAFPGVNFVQLGQQVSFGASTLNYHLRVLEKNGFITPVRDGRYLRFFDRRSGHYSGERKHAVSALRNPTSAAMARHIRDHPGVPQCDLAAAFGVTPSTVTWHMNRLATAGLVAKQRDGPHTRYFVAGGWAELPADEQARQAPILVAPVPVTA
jgi:DNA-binding transcriptional ArsR family regulator